MPSCFHVAATLARRALQGHERHFLPIRHVQVHFLLLEGYNLLMAITLSRGGVQGDVAVTLACGALQGYSKDTKILPTNSTCTILIAAIKQIGAILLSGCNPTIRKCLFPLV